MQKFGTTKANVFFVSTFNDLICTKNMKSKYWLAPSLSPRGPSRSLSQPAWLDRPTPSSKNSRLSHAARRNGKRMTMFHPYYPFGTCKMERVRLAVYVQEESKLVISDVQSVWTWCHPTPRPLVIRRPCFIKHPRPTG